MEFLTKEEARVLLADNAEDIHKLLNEVFSRIHNKAVEDAMRYTPELTARLIKMSLANQRLIKEFFDEHKEFAEHKDVVEAEVMKAETENPEKTYEAVLKIAAPAIQKKIAFIKSSA